MFNVIFFHHYYGLRDHQVLHIEHFHLQVHHLGFTYSLKMR